jgi:hypothetical protein
VTHPSTRPPDPLALDAAGVLIELHQFRSGASRASHQLAVYLPVTMDAQETPFVELESLELEQAVISICADIYDDLDDRLARKEMARYDATSPMVVAGLFAAMYARRTNRIALVLSPDHVRASQVSPTRRFVLHMHEGSIPAAWWLISKSTDKEICAFGMEMFRVRARATRTTTKTRVLADQVVLGADVMQTLTEMKDRLRAQQHPLDGAQKPTEE